MRSLSSEQLLLPRKAFWELLLPSTALISLRPHWASVEVTKDASAQPAPLLFQTYFVYLAPHRLLPDPPDRGEAESAAGGGRGQRPDRLPLQAKGIAQLGLQLTQLDPAVVMISM